MSWPPCWWWLSRGLCCLAFFFFFFCLDSPGQHAGSSEMVQARSHERVDDSSVEERVLRAI